LAFWAAEFLNCEQWDCGWVIGHCIPPLGQAGAQHSLSPVDAEVGAGDGNSMISTIPESVVNIAHIHRFYWRWLTPHFSGRANSPTRSVSRNHDDRDDEKGRDNQKSAIQRF
jgi:hypothetical protein